MPAEWSDDVRRLLDEQRISQLDDMQRRLDGDVRDAVHRYVGWWGKFLGIGSLTTITAFLWTIFFHLPGQAEDTARSVAQDAWQSDVYVQDIRNKFMKDSWAGFSDMSSLTAQANAIEVRASEVRKAQSTSESAILQIELRLKSIDNSLEELRDNDTVKAAESLAATLKLSDEDKNALQTVTSLNAKLDGLTKKIGSVQEKLDVELGQGHRELWVNWDNKGQANLGGYSSPFSPSYPPYCYGQGLGPDHHR